MKLHAILVRLLIFITIIIVIIYLFVFQVALSQNKALFYPKRLENPEKYFKKFFNVNVPEKSEFESDSEYSLRFPSLDTEKLVWFPAFDVTHKYDYKSRKLEMFVRRIEEVHYEQPEWGNKIEICAISKKGESYIGQNSLGVKTKVDVWNVDHYYLSNILIDSTFSHRLMMSYEYKDREYQILFDTIIAPKNAESLSKNLRAAFAVKVHSYRDRGQTYDGQNATLSDPVDRFVTNHFINASLEKLILYDVRQNTIIKEITNTHN